MLAGKPGVGAVEDPSGLGVVALPSAEVEPIRDRADARVAHEHELMAQLRGGATTLELHDFSDAPTPETP